MQSSVKSCNAWHRRNFVHLCLSLPVQHWSSLFSLTFLCYLLTSCKFPNGQGFYYFPWEAFLYQGIKIYTDTHLCFSLLLHKPFCFSLEGSSLPHVYTSQVSVCSLPLVIASLGLLISALVVCQSFQQPSGFPCYLSFLFRLEIQLVQFLCSNCVSFELVSTLSCCFLHERNSFIYPFL